MQDLAHFGPRGLGDDARTARNVSVFRVVGNGVAHVRDAAFIDQIDDQLHFVKTLEIRHFGRVSRFDQSFKARLNQGGQPAAQHHLLAEEIGLGFFRKLVSITPPRVPPLAAA